MKKRVLIVDSDPLYNKMFIDRDWELVTSIFDADLVQFTGGEDVDPALYGAKRHSATYANPIRDKREIAIYEQAQELGIPCAGICRGGQLLNVLNGGKMYQDVDNHGRAHQATLQGPVGKVRVSSTHHQMMRPPGKDEIILLVASESTQKEAMEGNLLIRTKVSKDHPDDDIEAVYFPQTNCLSFQPHPEYSGYEECQNVYFYFLHNYLLGHLNNEETTSDLYMKFLGDKIPF
jgi:gamma-glutamyl-gamma-aminobutyrate hydrolase PuuD